MDETDDEEEELKVYIKPLSKDAAFNKGVEWWSEIFFFYGLLMAAAIYEIRRAHNSSIRAQGLLDRYEKDIITANEELKKVYSHLEDARKSRLHNLSLIEDLSSKVTTQKVKSSKFGKGMVSAIGNTPMV